ncbi:MAG: 2Fe-2S iron-sulfur cluster binding domain-containing protein [Oscillospiraceae bacterium]|nr:2Fe-2S iron-sulfur cluster binding domain-containing protein [Oscillospiraceae bacterium]
MSIKVKGFLKDVGGASRVTKLREENFAKGSAVPDPRDPIREVADLLHPEHMIFKVVDIREASPTSRIFRFESADGHIPPFQSGQYVNFRLKIGESVLSRPYTISSAPYEALGEHPFFEITVRRNVPYLVPDYLFENVKVGDELQGALPFGFFYWEPMRDSKEIVALAGGSGITPFHSMAKEIAYGKMKGCKLTILYGSVKANDIVLKDDLAKIEAACPDIKVVHVLSDEPDWPGEKGFISREIIEKYSSPDCTYMFCGPLAMFTFVKKALDGMGITSRRFRHDVVNNPADVSTLPGYPKGTETKTFQITVLRGIHEDVIEARASEPVAVALERAGIPIDTHCRNGECGFCRSHLLEGEIFVSPIGDGRRRMDKEMGWFHACSSWPLTDLKIKIPIM